MIKKSPEMASRWAESQRVDKRFAIWEAVCMRSAKTVQPMGNRASIDTLAAARKRW